MRPLVYFVACTVDGFIAASDGSVEAFGFEGPQVADLLAEFPEMLPGHLREPFGVSGENRRFDTVLMGRATYAPALDLGITSPYPHLRQIVVSTTLGTSPDPGVTVVGGDVVDRVRALKAEPGRDVWLCGGGRLAAALAGEIDELVLKVSPFLLGAGVPLFAGPIGPRALTLTGERTYPDGYAVRRYALAG